ncbi:MAG: PolC-type DNA polymerase III [Firmicutes bacterium]|nr:PolC-type DNA polymerase III [Bacillota bacterium]
MGEEYLLKPAIRNISELRGIDETSLSFETRECLRRLSLEEVIIHNRRGPAGTGYLELKVGVSAGLTPERQKELEVALSDLAGVECKITPVGKDEEAAVDWPRLLEAMKKKLPGLYGWLTPVPPETDGYGRLCLKVGSPLAVEYLKRREDKLQAFFREELGRTYRLSYEIVEEEGEPPDYDYEEENRRQAREAAEAAALASEKSAGEVLLGRKIRGKSSPIRELPEEGRAVIEGEVFMTEVRSLRSGGTILLFLITDFTDSLTVKVFSRNDREKLPVIREGSYLRVKGKLQYDEFQKEPVMIAESIQTARPVEVRDEAETKRVELHLHTKMSAMDSVVDLREAVKTAAAWGHSALAVTDHGVVQAYPEAAQLAKEYGIKIIYGMEGYVIHDQEPVLTGVTPDYGFSEAPLVVLALGTTGVNPHRGELSGLAALRIERGEAAGEFIPASGGLLTDETLREFLAFAGGAVIALYNTGSGWHQLYRRLRKIDRAYQPPVLSILHLCRALRLSSEDEHLPAPVAELGGAITEEGRGASVEEEARALREIIQEAFAVCREKGITSWRELEALLSPAEDRGNLEQLRSHHILVLVRNITGLNNLYRLVSESHLRYFHRYPRIPKSLLTRYREGLLLGTACESGELFSALLAGAEEEELAAIAGFYDFLEIQPLGNNEFLLREGRLTREELMELNREICRLGEKYGKPVVATGDVHFLRPQDEVFRRILMAGQGYTDADRQPPLYFRTTGEMLAEFSYLPPETAYRVVVENPRRLAADIEELEPSPAEFCPPESPGAGEEIRRMAYERAREVYGDPLPSRIQEQLEWELQSIINHGYAVIFLIAHKLVIKSLEDGYLVGSRGSVGSSLVATMCGITEVNPLPAHYLCPACKYLEFPENPRRLSGVDLPAKDCPRCGQPLQKEGHDIPFATFMGFEGDKEPDIDLNFSGEYQAEVQRYTEELFGKDRVFRAGTISTLAEKTAFGFVRGYLDERGLRLKSAEINRLVKGCSGVKRTTGQHPGGMMIIPTGLEIYNFTPVQYPANDRKAEWITTHFDYRSLSGRLVKLDLLGHDDPTVLKMLSDLTGVDPTTIPLDDPGTLALFSSAAPLGLDPEELGFDLGTNGIPEFGTEFVRQMLAETKPATFSELVYISGLSHGTGVWLGNAQELIKKKVATLSEVISTRDDIMNYLIDKGLPPRQAFGIMERVRKGKGLSDEEVKTLKEYGVPDWYIDSCRKIQYMFPKAHAVAYVMMAFRIAYFKLYHPEAFYASYFTVRANDFDAGLMLTSPGESYEQLQELKRKGNEASAREKNLYTILEVVREAMLRGIRFLPVDLYLSDPTRFLITPEGLRVPLVSLPGLGENAAICLDRARREKKFFSVEDLKTRARLSSAVIDVLKKNGCLNGLPEKNQLTLF